MPAAGRMPGEGVGDPGGELRNPTQAWRASAMRQAGVVSVGDPQFDDRS
jgi:hypothetical protein